MNEEKLMNGARKQLIAGSYFLLVAYIVSHTLDGLIAGSRPSASWVGVGLAAFTAPTCHS